MKTNRKTIHRMSPTAAALMLLMTAAATHGPAFGQTIEQATGAEASVSSVPRAGNANTPPISNDSVRGDVLLTMLDQWTCGPVHQSTGVDGKRANEALRSLYPDINADNTLAPTNYVEDPEKGPIPPSFTFRPTCSAYFKYTQPKEGSYKVVETVAPFYYGYVFARGFNHWSASTPLTITRDGFSLGTEVQTVRQVDTRSGSAAGTDQKGIETFMKTTKPFSAKLTSAVPYGVLMQWTDGGRQNYQMMLLKGNEGQAKLCWNTNTDIVRRLHCGTWSAPAGWKRGQTLKSDGHYVIEDRAPYAGEGGMIYFNDRSE